MVLMWSLDSGFIFSYRFINYGFELIKCRFEFHFNILLSEITNEDNNVNDTEQKIFYHQMKYRQGNLLS